jgi:protein-L-isoaspartate(D-aspartate) O-methyltransferase
VTFLLHPLSWLARALPRGAALALGAALGWLWYRLVPVRRRVALENLRQAFPTFALAARRRILRASLMELGRSTLELLRVPGLDRAEAERLVEHQGEEHLRSALAGGRGALVVTAHFGAFDLLACAEALRGLKLAVVSRELGSRGVNRFWMRLRRRTGLTILPSRGSALQIHRLLRQGWVVALVIDQHMPPGRGLSVPFFGRPASTTHAPAVLSLGSGAPIVPVTVERLSDGRLRASFEPAQPPPRGLPPGARAGEILRVTRGLNAWLEDRIRARPDHWLWIHRRWKLPVAEPGTATAGSGSVAARVVWLAAAASGLVGGPACRAQGGSEVRAVDMLEHRIRLVEHLAAGGIRDARVLAAMRKVPRHRFVPADLLPEAYRDHPLPIGQGQTISQPYIVAYMSQALRLQGPERVLEIGTGSGYQAAVLAELAAQVYSIEILPELSERAGQALRALGARNVRLRVGDGYQGWPEEAPFDAIMLTAAPRTLPRPLADQLKEGGYLCAPLGPGENQVLHTYQKRAGELVEIDRLPVRFVPMTGRAERPSP